MTTVVLRHQPQFTHAAASVGHRRKGIPLRPAPRAIRWRQSRCPLSSYVTGVALLLARPLTNLDGRLVIALLYL
jgi:hypothetical protein